MLAAQDAISWQTRPVTINTKLRSHNDHVIFSTSAPKSNTVRIRNPRTHAVFALFIEAQDAELVGKQAGLSGMRGWDPEAEANDGCTMQFGAANAEPSWLDWDRKAKRKKAKREAKNERWSDSDAGDEDSEDDSEADPSDLDSWPGRGADDAQPGLSVDKR